jgi:ALMS motif
VHNVGDFIDSGKLTGKNSELMSRLARGEKVEVSKKDMLRLTNKNYEQLPEVRKKKEEEKKKEEMRERMK